MQRVGFTAGGVPTHAVAASPRVLGAAAAPCRGCMMSLQSSRNVPAAPHGKGAYYDGVFSTGLNKDGTAMAVFTGVV